MREFEVVLSGPLWKVGGIIVECEWDCEADDLLMWDGSKGHVERGDRVLMLQRGLPYAQFVAIERGVTSGPT